MQKSRVLCLLFSLVILNVSAQKLEYEMFLMGDKIGTLVTEKKVKGDLEVYTLVSKASSKILWKHIDAETSYRAVFKAGKLQESYYEHKENGAVERYCKVATAGDGYAIHHWKNGKFNVGSMADHCLVTIYYREPVDGLRMFNEGWGEYTSVKKTGANQYEFKAPGGDKNIYRYEGGRVKDAEFHTSIVSVKLRPKA